MPEGGATRHKWKLSRTSEPSRAGRTRLERDTGARQGCGAKNNVIAADAIAAGEGRFGLLFWVESPTTIARELLEAL